MAEQHASFNKWVSDKILLRTNRYLHLQMFELLIVSLAVIVQFIAIRKLMHRSSSAIIWLLFVIFIISQENINHSAHLNLLLLPYGFMPLDYFFIMSGDSSAILEAATLFIYVLWRELVNVSPYTYIFSSNLMKSRNGRLFLTSSIFDRSLMNCCSAFLLSSTATVLLLLMIWLMSVWTLMIAEADSGNFRPGNIDTRL